MRLFPGWRHNQRHCKLRRVDNSDPAPPGRVYPGINMLTFKIAVGIVVTIDGNFNIVRFPNLIAEFGIAWYSKRLNRF